MAQSACKAMALSSSSSSPGITQQATAGRRLTPNILGHGASFQGFTMLRHNYLKNVGMAVAAGRSLPLPSFRGTPLRIGDKHKASRLNQSGCGVARVWASSIGVVREVKLVSKEPLYYNVALKVSPTSEVAKWYNTPGQYVDLIPVQTNQDRAAAFFIASAPTKPLTELEFLIEDVTNSVANEIINSKPGDQVCITTNSWSTGFALSELNPIEESQSILMFASGYGLGPFRALIETGFEAKKRKDAILYAMYTSNQAPYMDKYSAWEKTGIEVQLGIPNIISTNPANTVVLMVASEEEQEMLAKYFEGKGVSVDRILTLFGGITSSEKSAHNKVMQKLNHYPKFLHHAVKHVPVGLKL